MSNTVGISNIQITNAIGELFSIANYSYFLSNRIVKVSFDVDYEDIAISSIKYTIWTKNDLSMFEKTYYVGTNRSHNFVLEGDRGGLYYGINIGDVITVKIEMTDINGLVNPFFAEEFVPAPILNTTTKPGFSSIYGYQRQDGSQLIDVYYNYKGLSGVNASNVSAYLSIDDGLNWSIISSKAMKGDVGSGVMPGLNRVIWNPLLTLSNSSPYPNSAEIKFVLNDADGNDNIGIESAVVVMDLYKPEIAIRKLSIEEEMEMFNSSSSSSIDSSSSSSSSTSSSSSSESSVEFSSSSSSSGDIAYRLGGTTDDPPFFVLNSPDYIWQGTYHNGKRVYSNGNYWLTYSPSSGNIWIMTYRNSFDYFYESICMTQIAYADPDQQGAGPYALAMFNGDPDGTALFTKVEASPDWTEINKYIILDGWGLVTPAGHAETDVNGIYTWDGTYNGFQKRFVKNTGGDNTLYLVAEYNTIYPESTFWKLEYSDIVIAYTDESDTPSTFAAPPAIWSTDIGITMAEVYYNGEIA